MKEQRLRLSPAKFSLDGRVSSVRSESDVTESRRPEREDQRFEAARLGVAHEGMSEAREVKQI